MLKYQVDAVTDDIAQFYAKNESTGKYVLQVEGVVAQSDHEELKTKLSEFRSSNNTLKKQLEEFAEFEQVVGANGKGTKDGVKNTIEALTQARTQQMKAEFDKMLSDKETRLKNATHRLMEVLVSDAVKAAALSHGVTKTAVDDVVTRARAKFTVNEDFKVVCSAQDGDKDGNPLTIETFVASLKDTAPHLFAPSQGTGGFNRSRVTEQQSVSSSPVDLISKGLKAQTR